MTTIPAISDYLKTNKKELISFLIPEEAMLNAKTLEQKRSLSEVYFTKFKCQVLTQLQINPKVLECSLDSIYDSITKGMGLQLELGREYHVVPYSNKVGNTWIKQATFIADYKGWLTLARRSPLVENIDVQPVFENDSVKATLGENPSLVHNLEPFKERGKFVGVYAIVWLRGTAIKLIETMQVPDIDKIRAISKQPEGSAWSNSYIEMARKSVLHRILKRAPREIRKNMQPVLQDWESNFEFSKKPIIEGETVKEPPKNLPDETTNPTDQLNAAFDAKEKAPAKAKAKKKDEPQAVDDAAQFEKGCDEVFGEDTRETVTV